MKSLIINIGYKEGDSSMKNTYYIGYFPLVSIFLFSLSFAIFAQMKIIKILQWLGLYDGILSVFEEKEVKLTLLIILIMFFFMLFSALKLFAQTVNEISLLFFSNDREGDILKNIRPGSVIFFIGGIVSIFSFFNIGGLLLTFIISTVVYFIYFVYKISDTLTIGGIVGIIFFQVFTWGVCSVIIIYSLLKWYNIILNSFQIPST